ncbi:MAG: MoaD/ThiS family protein [Gammaproteobacteria bacterium]|nr:MoaD/ThiS family protein [Gammaproteobacteria bacterium]
MREVPEQKQSRLESRSTWRTSLPDQLQRLAKVERELSVAVDGPVTQRCVLDALERAYPALRGTIRDHAGQRRPKVRVFACNEDVSHNSPDDPLPAAVAAGTEPLFILGAISGG